MGEADVRGELGRGDFYLGEGGGGSGGKPIVAWVLRPMIGCRHGRRTWAATRCEILVCIEVPSSHHAPRGG